jgi:hypothetical protein
VLVTTQDPMMIRSWGLSSTFNAMPVLRCSPLCRGNHAGTGFGGADDALMPAARMPSFPNVVNTR